MPAPLRRVRRAAVVATGVTAAVLATALVPSQAGAVVAVTQVVGFDDFNYWDSGADPTPPTLWWIDFDQLGGAAESNIVNRTPASGALDGSVQLRTNGAAADEVQVGTLDAAGTAVAGLTALAYSTKTDNAGAVPRLEVTASCDAGADLRLVFDPTRFGNTAVGGGAPSTSWQRWDAAAGTWYLSRTLGALAGGAANGHSLAAIKAACTGGSGAVVSHGVAAGPSWPAADTSVDLVTLNATTTDFLYDYAVRLAGPTRIETAISISFNSFGDDSAEGAVVARADLFPDALAGVPLAGAYGGPLLLTPPSTLLPDVSDELDRVLEPGAKVFVVGGTGALSPAVESALKTKFGAGNVVRIGGSTRIETSLLVAAAVKARAGALTGVDFGPVLAATGRNFPDALSAGPAALANPDSLGAVVLTNDYSLPGNVATFLANEQTAGTPIVAVGGQAKGALGSLADVSYAGTDRFHTSALVADSGFLFPTGDEYWGLASGLNFPDAMSGGAALGSLLSPVLITSPTSLSTRTGDLIKLRHTQLGFGLILGGIGAVTETAATKAFGYASGSTGALPYAPVGAAGAVTSGGPGAAALAPSASVRALREAVAKASARVHLG
jgi:hypothetical protein